jgi:DNA-3-methyladenine glycosylase II
LPAKICIEPLKGRIDKEQEVVNFVRDWLDVDRDLSAFYSLLRKDADLSHFPDAYRGFHIVGIPDLFETIVWCIIGQQINLDFAYKVKRALVERYGTRVMHGRASHFLFPEPAVLAALTREELMQVQLTGRKAEFIIGVATLMRDGKLSKRKLQALRSEERMLEELTAIRGIGEWSANYALMKSLRAMNRVPFGDAGINIALNRLKNIPKKNNRAEVEAVFSKFGGWKTYLVYYLWRSRREREIPL